MLNNVVLQSDSISKKSRRHLTTATRQYNIWLVSLTEFAGHSQSNYYNADSQSNRRLYCKGDFLFGGQDFYFVCWRLENSDRQRSGNPLQYPSNGR